MNKPHWAHNPQTGWAVIIDNRDGSTETICAYGPTTHAAKAQAFIDAMRECDRRNAMEAYPRFVALRDQRKEYTRLRGRTEADMGLYIALRSVAER